VEYRAGEPQPKVFCLGMGIFAQLVESLRRRPVSKILPINVGRCLSTIANRWARPRGFALFIEYEIAALQRRSEKTALYAKP
jgi:hypothetical protein